MLLLHTFGLLWWSYSATFMSMNARACSIHLVIVCLCQRMGGTLVVIMDSVCQTKGGSLAIVGWTQMKHFDIIHIQNMSNSIITMYGNTEVTPAVVS